MSDYRRGLDWRLDVGHLQVVTSSNCNTIAIYTFYSSLEHTVWCSRSVTRCFLVKAPTVVIPLPPGSSPLHRLPYRTGYQLSCEWVIELVYDRQSFGQSVLEESIHLGLSTRFCINVRQLRVCWWRAPSLTRVRVCHLLCTVYNIFAFYMLFCVIHSLT
jgi:hypothetical protein